MERLQKFWLAGACYTEKEKKGISNKTLGILNFTSAFILLGGGVLLSVVLLLVEHIYYRFGRKCLMKVDSGCCSFVSLVCNIKALYYLSLSSRLSFCLILCMWSFVYVWERERLLAIHPSFICKLISYRTNTNLMMDAITRPRVKAAHFFISTTECG